MTMAAYRSISVDRLMPQFKYEPETGNLFRLKKNGWKLVSLRSTYQSITVKRSTGVYCSVNAHVLIWALHYGKWPDHTIDHINGDTRDNRISNLRDVSLIVNCRNRGGWQ